MNAAHRHAARINLRLRDLAQLFNSMDPSPFLDQDLDQDAEEFIISSAQELPKAHGYELVVHLLTAPPPQKSAELETAVRHYFASRAEIKRREFRLLLRRGQVSLLIGVLFLTVCLLASGVAGRMSEEPAASVAREGLLIAGWVAMWRPLETFLYDWWPVREEWKNLQRLARMHVRVICADLVKAEDAKDEKV